MAILTLRNVKSYSADKDVNIDLSKPVTLIYGQNGAGKSTISSFFQVFNKKNTSIVILQVVKILLILYLIRNI